MSPSFRHGYIYLMSFVFSLASACGGGGSSSSSDNGGLAFRALWEQPAAARSARGAAAGDVQANGFGPELPPSVKTVRMFFAAESGERCCVAIDPDLAPTDPSSGQRYLLLRPLPAGPGEITISGFPTDFAPTVDGVSEVCSVSPAGLGEACVESANQSPSFTSDAHPVVLVKGVDTDAGDILIRAVPFLPEGGFRPMPGDEPTSPVSVEVTIVDAGSGIDPNSIEVSVRQGPDFIDIDFTVRPCNDGSVNVEPCSPGRDLGSFGFIVQTLPQDLLPGDAEFRVRATNRAQSPGSLEFFWTVRVRPGATPTARPTATRAPTNTAVPTQTAVPTSTFRPTPRPTFTATRVPTNTRQPTPLPSFTPTPEMTATPTLTPTQTISPTPTVTRTPTPPCSGSVSVNPCVPGGAANSRTSCFLEWLLDPVPERNASLIPKSITTCYEGDPECDVDGKINGECAFSVSLCINNSDPRLLSCSPSDLSRFELLRPDPVSPGDAFDVYNRDQLEGQARNGFGVTVLRNGTPVSIGRPNDTIGLCGTPLSIRVPVGRERPGRETLRIRTETSNDDEGASAVTLRCASSTCGNGTVEEHEECDDGNRRDGDGCDQGCQLELNGAAAAVAWPAHDAE